MTTIADVKKLVQPLLARNPDLALVGRFLVLKPVRHILRGIYIDRTSSVEDFRPKWTTFFLFEPDVFVSFNWGEDIYYPQPGRWDVRNPEVQECLCQSVEASALPLLKTVETIEEFVEFTKEDRFPRTSLALYDHRKVIVDAALGDFSSADQIIERMKRRASKTWRDVLDEDYDRILTQLAPLIARRDRAGIARLLHEWELFSVTKLKLMPFWETTPFPIEAQSG